jgi:hypothetical protein
MMIESSSSSVPNPFCSAAVAADDPASNHHHRRAIHPYQHTSISFDHNSSELHH